SAATALNIPNNEAARIDFRYAMAPRIAVGTAPANRKCARLIQEGARTALSARYFGEMIETRGHGCPRSFREILESAVGNADAPFSKLYGLWRYGKLPLWFY